MKTKGKAKRLLTMLLAFVMLVGLIPTTAFAVGTETVGDFTVTGGTKGEDYTYADGVLRIIKSGADLTIQNITPAMATTDRIYVAKDISANITLAGVNIDVSGDGNHFEAAFQIADNSKGNVTITLENGTKNILKSGSNAAGLQKNGDEDVGTLTIKGTGALDATGGKGAAGIGGSWSSKRIVINSGTIEATGGMNAAGIGGAANSSGEVTITGGTVNATGLGGGAGIGGGWSSASSGSSGSATGTVTITGGIVTATGGTNYSRSYVLGGAGIGGGVYGDGTVTISGGEVKATGGYGAAGIGGGSYDGKGTVKITGGTVTAAAGSYASSIGSGVNGKTAALDISVAVTEHDPKAVTIPIQKIVQQGGTEAPGETEFQFNLYELDSEGNIKGRSVARAYLEFTDMTTHNRECSMVFSIPYDIESGTYKGGTYTLKEESFGEENWKYDTTEYSVSIDSDGNVSIKTSGESTTVDYAEFTNIYTENQSPAPTTYTVSFDMNDHGTQVAAQTINEGANATEPTDPAAEGYTFKGWYTDKECTNAFDFNLPIKTDYVLYAKWEKDASKPTEPSNPVEPTNPNEPAEPTDQTKPEVENPKTGDNSNMVLWVTLLLVSGAGLLGTAAYSKKKKSAK